VSVKLPEKLAAGRHVFTLRAMDGDQIDGSDAFPGGSMLRSKKVAGHAPRAVRPLPRHAERACYFGERHAERACYFRRATK